MNLDARDNAAIGPVVSAFKPAAVPPPATDMARRHKATIAKAAKLRAKRAKYQARLEATTAREKDLTKEMVSTAISLYAAGHVDESVLALVYIIEGRGNALYKENDGAVSVLKCVARERGGPPRTLQVIRLHCRQFAARCFMYVPGGSRWRSVFGNVVKADGTLVMPNDNWAKQERTDTEHCVRYTDKTVRLALSEALDRVHAYKTRVVNAVATHLRTADIPELIVAMAGGCPMSLWDRVPTKRRSGGDTTEEDE
jgi:hypothetical protein